MYKVLDLKPFGFVIELEGGSCYFTEPYEVYINHELHCKGDTNVLAIYGLAPNKLYHVEIKGAASIAFDIRTLKPSYVVNVKDYNAAGDGVANDTSAINAAIYTAAEGATVYIPKGRYLVDQVLLKSRVDIYLEEGAVLLQNTNRDSLAILKAYQRSYDHDTAYQNASWEGHPLDSYASLIYGKDVELVHIYGKGVIDGQGDIGGFWDNPKIKNKAWRPKNVLLINCHLVTLSGLVSRNSASWNIHPINCDNIELIALKIESIEESPNTDGINPESSGHVSIIGCHFSVGDDCIAIKAGKYFMSQKHLRPSRNIHIRNCFMEHGHGAVVMGSELSCGIYDVFVSQCYFKGTDRGLRIKTRRGRGEHAVVSGVVFDNILMEDVTHGFVINMFYHCDPDGKSEHVSSKEHMPKDKYTPSIAGVTFKNIVAKGIKGAAIFVYGLPESPVEGIVIENYEYSFADKRVTELPAMMEPFPIDLPVDTFFENSEVKIGENN